MQFFAKPLCVIDWPYKKISYFISKRGPKGAEILKFCIFDRYIEFLYFIQLIVELIVLRAFGNMLTDFLYLLQFQS